MTRVRRRRTRDHRGLTRNETFYLLTGHLTVTLAGTAAFSTKRAGVWVTDEAAARSAWEDNRDEVYEQALPGHVPWAAIRFDGVKGRCSYREGRRPSVLT